MTREFPDPTFSDRPEPHDFPSGSSVVDAIEAAIAGRRSVRAYKPDPVPAKLVEHLLDIAARAPSGTNMQPWRVYALAGVAQAKLASALKQAHDDTPSAGRVSEYEYYPAPLFEPYIGRRRKVGYDLYGLLGIGRGDHARMHAQHGRNLQFFDAPVGLIFTVHRELKIGSWLDYGMFLQNIMIAARAHGLETCAQAAFAPFHGTIRANVPIPDDEVVICGMALGYENRDAPENGLRTIRVPASEFATLLGFEAPGAAADLEPISRR